MSHINLLFFAVKSIAYSHLANEPNASINSCLSVVKQYINTVNLPVNNNDIDLSALLLDIDAEAATPNVLILILLIFKWIMDALRNADRHEH